MYDTQIWIFSIFCIYLGMAVNKLSIGSVNKMTYEDFIARFGNVVEHCSLCAAAVWRERPFRDAENLASCFGDFIDRLPINGKCHRLHPWSGVRIYLPPIWERVEHFGNGLRRWVIHINSNAA